jgi:hypothetical protein
MFSASSPLFGDEALVVVRLAHCCKILFNCNLLAGGRSLVESTAKLGDGTIV